MTAESQTRNIKSTQTIQFQAAVRVILRHKVRRLLGGGKNTKFLSSLNRPELELLFNKLKYGN